MTEMQVFTNSELGSVRTVAINDAPWFIGKDVAEVLGYKNSRDALAKHVDEEDKNTVAIHDGIQGNPNQVVVNESGVYSLIFSSKLPAAKKFKRWVTSEVLPAIRKYGVYASTDLLRDQLALKQALNDLTAERDRAECFHQQAEHMVVTIASLQEVVEISRQESWELKNEVSRLQDELNAVRKDAEYADRVLSSKSLIPISVIAAEYGLTARQLNEWLKAKGVITKVGNRWMPGAAYRDKGYVGFKTYSNTASEETKTSMSWTQKGRKLIHEMLDNAGFTMMNGGY